MITRSQTRRLNEVKPICNNKENENLINIPPKKPARKVGTRQLKQNKKMNEVICDLYTKNIGKNSEINKSLDKNTHEYERESDCVSESSSGEVDKITPDKTWESTIKLDRVDGNSCFPALSKNVSELFHTTKKKNVKVRINKELFHTTKGKNAKVRTIPSAVFSSKKEVEMNEGRTSTDNLFTVDSSGKEQSYISGRPMNKEDVNRIKDTTLLANLITAGGPRVGHKGSDHEILEESTTSDIGLDENQKVLTAAIGQTDHLFKVNKEDVNRIKDTTLLTNLITADTVGHKGSNHKILEESTASYNRLDENQKVQTVAVGQTDHLFKVDTSGRHHDDRPSDDDDDSDEDDDIEEDDINALPAPKVHVESRFSTFKSYGSKKNDVFDLEDTYLDISLNDKRGMNINKEARRFCKVDEVLKKSVITSGFEKLDSVPSYQESDKILQKKRKKERERTKGSNWFNMPAKELTEEVKNDLEVLQMRSILDPKHFYKKNDLKVLPKYFQVGKVVESAADYYHSRIPKKQRKRTIVEELLADSEFKKYNKKRYKEIIQERRKSHYKAHVHAKKLKHKK